MKEFHTSEPKRREKRQISRRQLIKGTAVLLTGVVAGCVAKQPSPESQMTPTSPPTISPTSIPATASPSAVPLTASPTSPPPTATHTLVPTATQKLAASTATPLPTITAIPTATSVVATPNRSDLMRIYPSVKSRVVLARHSGACPALDQPMAQPPMDILRQMLDVGITELTGLRDADQAWRALFDSRERVAIKVNCISRYTSTVSLATAVANRLHEAAGIPLENMVVFDRDEYELKRAGYVINRDGPGLRCYSTREYSQPVRLSAATVRFSDILLSCDALINIPIPKEHGTAGVSLAMKNHYGTIDNPAALHGGNCDPAIAELNAAAPIRDRARLIIGDALRMCPYNWNQAVPENALIFAFDPVAHDAIGRQLLIRKKEADGQTAGYLQHRSVHIATAAKLGLGTDKPENMELKEVKLA